MHVTDCNEAIKGSPEDTGANWLRLGDLVDEILCSIVRVESDAADGVRP